MTRLFVCHFGSKPPANFFGGLSRRQHAVVCLLSQWQMAMAAPLSRQVLEQQLLDWSKENGGFNGGLMDYAFDFFKSVTDYIYISGASGLMSTIILQPVSVAVEADQTAVQSYSGGIVSSDCGTYLDHGILVVGYDSAAGYSSW